jgi:tRNA 2-thiouridine synthesizing protein A
MEQAERPLDLPTRTREMQVSNAVLDAKGLNCPLPILKASTALQRVPAGGLLEIHATDPGAVKDFQAFCRSTGNELVSSSQEGNVFKFVIKRVK